MHILLLTGAWLAVAMLAAKLWAPLPGAPGRYPAIEQLRGILALMVLWSHAVRMPGLYAPGPGNTPVWAPVFPEHGPLMNLGSLAVGLFFCITGFLFWERQVPPETSRFLEGRVRRLAVPFLATASLCAGLTVGLLCWESGPRGVWHHARQIVSFFTFGLTDEAHPSTIVLMGMAWSLAYEWAFYLALPLLWVLRQKSRLLPHLVFPGVLYYACSRHCGTLGLYLWAGMCVAEVAPYLRTKIPALNISLFSWSCAGLFLALVCTGVFNFYWYQAPVLAVLFLSVTLAGERQGPLGKSLVLARLGRMTYSLYLIHGTVLYLLFMPATRLLPMKSAFALEVWTAIATVVSIAMARLWFELFEKSKV
jgi:peptidoglycan/LPS O-acetylase OafA/YrhL